MIAAVWGVLIPLPGNRCQDGSRINTLLHASYINTTQTEHFQNCLKAQVCVSYTYIRPKIVTMGWKWYIFNAESCQYKAYTVYLYHLC